MVDVTDVTVSPDGRHANVKVALGGSEHEQNQAMAALEHARNYLRHELASRLSPQEVPELHFEPDQNPDAATRVEILLKRAKKKRARRKISPKVKQTVVVLFLLTVGRPPGLPRPAGSCCAWNRAPRPWAPPIPLPCTVTTGKMEAAVEAAFDEARQLDSMLSNYKPDSEWSEVNRRLPAKPGAISPELFQLLAACQEYSRQSEGAFDISVGPLMKVWGFYKGTGHLPHRAEVMAAMTSVGYRHVHLDPAGQTVSFDRPGVELDPGGIGKGYAVDRMVDVLKRKGISIALVAASGSSIYGMGAPPNEPRGWRITIRDPWQPARQRSRGFLKNESMSTSGSYEKFFPRRRPRLQPHYGPAHRLSGAGHVSVSVITPRTIDSEAWAKPYFMNGRQWAAQHNPQGFRVFFAKTGRISHARGSNDKPLFGCLPAPAHRCAAGMVHAAGRPLHETSTGRSATSTASWKSASGPTWPPRSRCSRWKYWTWTPPSSSPTCCCPSSRWA
jgi:FAD:protein FMN transferase